MIAVPNKQKSITLDIEGRGQVDLSFSVSSSGGHRTIVQHMENIIKLNDEIKKIAQDAELSNEDRGVKLLQVLVMIGGEHQALAREVFGEEQYTQKLAPIADELPLETWDAISGEISKGVAGYIKDSLSTEGKRE